MFQRILWAGLVFTIVMQLGCVKPVVSEQTPSERLQQRAQSYWTQVENAEYESLYNDYLSEETRVWMDYKAYVAKIARLPYKNLRVEKVTIVKDGLSALVQVRFDVSYMQNELKNMVMKQTWHWEAGKWVLVLDQRSTPFDE